MAKRPPPEIIEVELKENDEFISRDDLDFSVEVDEEECAVYIKFSGFDDEEDAEEYAAFLSETLPLLLCETTRLH